MLNRVSSGLMYSVTGRYMNDVQARLDDYVVNQERGEKQDALDIRYTMHIGKELQKNDHYLQNLQLARLRLDNMETAIGSLIDEAERFKDTLVSQSTSVTKDVNLISMQAKELLQFAASQLNNKVAGGYIFSGEKIDRMPVQDINSPNFEEMDHPESWSCDTVNNSYYHGDSTRNSLIVGDGIVLNYGVAANDQAFKYLFGAAHISASKPDDTVGAQDMLDKAVDQLQQLRDDISINYGTSNRYTDYYQELNTELEHQQNDIKTDGGMDFIERFNKFKEDTAIMQYMMYMFVQTSNLNLLNYLK